MPPKRGLQTELHPALRTSNLNLLKVKRPRSGSPRALPPASTHDNANINDGDGTDLTGAYITRPLPNPYLADYSPPGSKEQREFGPRRRLLRFHQRGEIVKSMAEQRARATQIAQEQQARELQLKVEEEERRELVRKGELPDVSIGEDKYLPDSDGASTPTEILEWWDIPFVEIKKGSSYRILDRFTSGVSNSKRKQRKQGETSTDHDNDDDDDTDEPSILYVWHPELIRDKDKEEGSGLLKRVYLTKSEQKRLRRNKRQLQREEHELRIKLGLDPKPEPKVKLSNMMRVVENSSNILDPTKYEQQVRQQVDQRRQRHELTNSERHEAAVTARKKEKLGKSEDTHSGTESMCYVYRFKSLSNPKIRYKLHMNSKQLKLKGCCLRIGEDGPGIIVAVGDEKPCKFFDNLVNRRIKWTDDYIDKSSNQKVDMSENFIKTEWSGYINTATTHKFVPWFMKSCSSEEELLKVLDTFNARQFYQR